jgi:diguanylate cyclase (GGDEF)-like protein
MAYPASADQPQEGSPSPAEVSEILTDLKRVNRALRTLSAGNHALLHASDERDLLQDMCKVIVEQGGYRQAVVGHVQPDEAKTIRWSAYAGTAMQSLSSILQTQTYTSEDTELGGTTTGMAIRTGKPIVGRHLFTDPALAGPNYDRVREDAVKLGYVSVTSLPLRINGEVIGALSIAAAEPDAFDDEEVRLLTELADNLSYGIANLRIRVQHREAQATIARLAYYDPLTGLPNRTQLLERLQDAMQTAHKQQRGLALLHVEVDTVQEINKVLGFRAGDQLLREVGQRLTRAVKQDELLARVGEADFALLLSQGGAEYSIEVAQCLKAALHQPVNVCGLLLDSRACIGIALYPNHASDPETLVRRANAAMHEARPGRGGYTLYTGSQEQEFTRRFKLMSDLRRAIEHDGLQLYCQPKVDIKSQSVCGAEALVRWQHPVHGIVPTIEFITLAEQAGLITPLTYWVLDAAFRQSHAWHEEGLDRALSVNLSAHDLHDPRLIDRLRGLFSTSGVKPESIQFELTESALMADPGEAVETLTRIKELGVELYIDDFGTGYSSLSYLQQLPVDWIKIDQAFVMPMLARSDSAVIVRSTIELGHNLNLRVVAEGVESKAVWDRLEGLGCDVAQGYLISKPMPAKDFQNWEASWEHAWLGDPPHTTASQ